MTGMETDPMSTAGPAPAARGPANVSAVDRWLAWGLLLALMISLGLLVTIGQSGWLGLIGLLLVFVGLALGTLGWRLRWLRKLQNGINDWAFHWNGMSIGLLILPSLLLLGAIVNRSGTESSADGAGLASIRLNQVGGEQSLLTAFQETLPPTIAVIYSEANLEIETLSYENYVIKYMDTSGLTDRSDCQTKEMPVAPYSRRQYSGYQYYLTALDDVKNGCFPQAIKRFIDAKEVWQSVEQQRIVAPLIAKADYDLALAYMCVPYGPQAKNQAQIDCKPDLDAAMVSLKALAGTAEADQAAKAWARGLFTTPATVLPKDWPAAAQIAASNDRTPEARQAVTVYAALNGNSPAKPEFCGTLDSDSDEEDSESDKDSSWDHAIGVCMLRAALGNAEGPRWDDAKSALAPLPDTFNGKELKTALQAKIGSELDLQAKDPRLANQVYDYQARNVDLVGWRASWSATINKWNWWFLLGVLAILANAFGCWLAFRKLALHNAMRLRIGSAHYVDRMAELARRAAEPAQPDPDAPPSASPDATADAAHSPASGGST